MAGLVLNLKPQFDKIAVWITNSLDTAGVATVKTDLATFLQIEESEIEYEVFKEVVAAKAAKKENPGKFDNKTKKFVNGKKGGPDNNNFKRSE